MRNPLSRLPDAVRKTQPHLLASIRELVRVESPSHNKAAVDAAVDLVAIWGAALGSRIKRHKNLKHGGHAYGDVLELRFAPPGRKADVTPVLILGHLDTVWELGTLQRMPIKERDGRIFGPGVYDMKAGVCMALAALRVLREAELPHVPVTLLLVSDEEVGSPVSRSLTEKLALQSSAVYVLEPAQGAQGAYKTSRKGVGGYRLEVKGVASHSGVDFTAGHSAVLELARQIEVIAGFTDLDRGLTVNPGIIGGGTRSNVVAASAWVEIDVRVARKADVALIEKKLHGLKAFDKKCSLALTGSLNRPPMERTKGTVSLYRKAATLAEGLGFKLEEAGTGGGSDGNFTSALGIPTLDGMGAVGQGAHASDESIVVDALVPRTALLAAMLLS